MRHLPLSSKNTLLAGFGGLMVVLVFIAFGRSIVQDFSPIDDHFLIINNLAIRGITIENLRTIFTTFDPELYIPLTFLSFQINYLVSGLHPWSYHLANLLLHMINAGLVAALMWKLTRHRWIALLCALVFAVHTLHTEAVVWVAGRKDLLSTFFFLLSLLSYMMWKENKKTGYMLSILCLLLGVLSKVSVAVLPAILLLWDLTYSKKPLHFKLITEKIPHILIGAGALAVAIFGKERVLGSATILETILMAGRSTFFYVGKFFLPLKLSPYYDFGGTIAIGDPAFLFPILIMIMLMIISVLWMKKRPELSFAALFFLITLAPNFFNFRKGALSFIAVDRYAYIPSIGLLLGLALLLGWGVSKITFTTHRKLIAASCSTVLVTTLVLLSRAQAAVWDSPHTLFTHALRVNPASIPARVDLATLKRKSGNLQEAFDLLKAGLNYSDHPLLYRSAGLILALDGRIDDAREQFEKSASMDPANPEPIFDLGSLAEKLGNEDEAMAKYRQAIGLDDSYVIAHVKLGLLLAKRDQHAEALQEFKKALKWNTNSLEANAAMGELLMKEGKPEEAKVFLDRAKRLR